MSGNKGPAFEREVVNLVKPIWPNARRSGRGFQGADILNTDAFSIECKHHSRDKLGEWMKQAELDAERDGKPFPVVVHKRKRYRAEHAYVTMTVETFVRIVGDLYGIDLDAHVEEHPVSDEDTAGP